MNMKRIGSALLLAAAPALCVACDSKAENCNEFFDVAAPIISSVSVPKSAPSGSAAVAWAHDAAKQYERLAKETEKIYERASDTAVKAALWDEKSAAVEVAKQLDELANAVTSVEPSKVVTIKSALSRAAQSERDAANALERQCAK